MNPPEDGAGDAAYAGRGEGPEIGLSEIASDALRYWEPRRLVYNLAMVIVVAGMYFYSIQDVGIWWPSILTVISLFAAAVGANVLYSIVYPIEIFVQKSDLRSLWLRYRWILFVLGTTLAVCLTFYLIVFSLGLLVYPGWFLI